MWRSQISTIQVKTLIYQSTILTNSLNVKPSGGQTVLNLMALNLTRQHLQLTYNLINLNMTEVILLNYH